MTKKSLCFFRSLRNSNLVRLAKRAHRLMRKGPKNRQMRRQMALISVTLRTKINLLHFRSARASCLNLTELHLSKRLQRLICALRKLTAFWTSFLASKNLVTKPKLEASRWTTIFQALLRADLDRALLTSRYQSQESRHLRRGTMRLTRIFKKISLMVRWTCPTTACKVLLRWENLMESRSVNPLVSIVVLTLWRWKTTTI